VSVRNALLALLEQGPRYGYQLRAEFEHRTGGTWPLNVGQVYTTLARLERDGLVEGRGADGEGRVMYATRCSRGSPHRCPGPSLRVRSWRSSSPWR
jgi:DNA-binding PadR family transcriptional regulator